MVEFSQAIGKIILTKGAQKRVMSAEPKMVEALEKMAETAKMNGAEIVDVDGAKLAKALNAKYVPWKSAGGMAYVPEDICLVSSGSEVLSGAREKMVRLGCAPVEIDPNMLKPRILPSLEQKFPFVKPTEEEVRQMCKGPGLSGESFTADLKKLGYPNNFPL